MSYYSSLLISDAQLNEESLRQLADVSFIQGNPDYQVIAPLEGKTSISIEQVHTLQSELGFKPYQERKRVIVISPADRLTLPAQQALLKVLEEPPAHTQMILVSDSPYTLLPTILSRLQNISHPSKSKTADSTEFDQLRMHCHTISGAIELAAEWGSSKETAISRLHKLSLFLYHHKLPARLEIARDLLDTCYALESNANTKLALEKFFFKYLKSL